jgi:hypothetical protein
MRIHPKIEELSNDDVSSLIRCGKLDFYWIAQGLSSSFALCLNLYSESTIRSTNSANMGLSRFNIYVSPFNYRTVTEINFDSLYYNTCTFCVVFLHLVNKRKSFTIFGFRGRNLYVVSKFKFEYHRELKSARKFLSAMLYLAEDLENGATNRIYHVR